MASVKFTRKELEKRNHRKDAAIIIDNVVYDVTEFLDEHPGGMDVLLKNAGKDASESFHEVRHSEIAMDWRNKFVVGEVADEDRWEVQARDTSDEPEEEPLTLGTLLNVWGPPLVIAGLAALSYMYLFP